MFTTKAPTQDAFDQFMRDNYPQPDSLAVIARYKSTVPFSKRLNTWMSNYLQDLIATGKIDAVDYTDDDSYDTFDKVKAYYDQTNRLKVWSGASKGTVFGDELSNWRFRAWHDYIHITRGFQFTTEGESMTAFVQAAELPEEWQFEKNLILCEVIGQVLYNAHHNGEFPTNQRKFAINYLSTGDITKKY